MKRIYALGLLFCILPLCIGVWGVERSSGEQYDAIWAGLISGAVVAGAIFVAESSRDRRAEKEARLNSARLQIALTNDLSYADLRGLDLRGMTLQGKKFVGANFEGCDLSSVDLVGVDLRGANIRYASFLNANLNSADLRLVDARHSDFRNATLIGADLRGGLFGDCDFRTTDAQGVLASTMSRGDVSTLRDEGVSFRSRYTGLEWLPDQEGEFPTRLDGVRADGSVWTGADLTRAILRGSSFRYVRFGPGMVVEPEYPFFRRVLAVLRGELPNFGSGWMGPGLPAKPASFQSADLTNADFTGAVGPELELTERQLSQALVPIERAQLREQDVGRPAEPELPVSEAGEGDLGEPSA